MKSSMRSLCDGNGMDCNYTPKACPACPPILFQLTEGPGGARPRQAAAARRGMAVARRGGVATGQG